MRKQKEKTIRILLADDQTIIRDGLRALLETYPDMEVIGQAKNGKQALTLVNEKNPDVVLMDVRMPEVDGVEATKMIKEKNPDTVVIMLTTFDDDQYIIHALANGASGYLLKDIGAEKLVEAIRDGMDGNILLPGRVAAKISSHLIRKEPTSVDRVDFTDREMDIIRCMVQGKSNAQIAETLFLSIGTVKNYLTQIYGKAGVGDRANAVLYFKRMGF